MQVIHILGGLKCLCISSFWVGQHQRQDMCKGNIRFAGFPRTFWRFLDPPQSRGLVGTLATPDICPRELVQHAWWYWCVPLMCPDVSCDCAVLPNNWCASPTCLLPPIPSLVVSCFGILPSSVLVLFLFPYSSPTLIPSPFVSPACSLLVLRVSSSMTASPFIRWCILVMWPCGSPFCHI